ncbi:MAG: class I SAM-dependent methyltransferase [Burkholderiales bacterium]
MAPVPAPAYRGSQRGYRLVAPAYDALFGRALAHGRRTAVAALDCRPGDHVLEVGVGSGLALGLYPSGTRVTGIDISRDMLSRARRRALRIEADFAQMDAGRLAFADATFDKAALLFTVGGLPAPVEALREVRRVCRPGATVVLVNRFRTYAPAARFFDGALAPLYGLLRYRVDLDAQELAKQSGLSIVRSHPANLFGYATVVVTRKDT